eukprot:SAG31_NODE_23311_length_506_cov_3.461916_1_plen_67_part_10
MWTYSSYTARSDTPAIVALSASVRQPTTHATTGRVQLYQGMYTRAVHSTVCGTIQLTTKYTNSKICY